MVEGRTGTQYGSGHMASEIHKPAPVAAGPAAVAGALSAADHRQLLRVAGLALAGAVWILGLIPLPAKFNLEFFAEYTGLITSLVLIEQLAPGRQAGLFRRVAWLALELALAFVIVRLHGSLN